MTTGLRCRSCDAPLVEAGPGWSCPEPDCPRFGKFVCMVMEPDEGAMPSRQVID